MITQMKKYTFLVFHRDYESFLEQLRNLGVVHITEKAAGMADDEHLQALLQKADSLRHLIEKGAPDQLLQERDNVEQQIHVTQREINRMSVWGEFSSKRLAELKEAGYTLRYFVCSIKNFNEEWGIEITRDNSRVYFVQVYHTDEQPAELPASCVEQTLNRHSVNELHADMDALNGLLAAANARIEAWSKTNLEKTKQQLLEVNQRIDWQRVTLSTDSVADGALCLLEGFCPIDKEPALNAFLATQQVYYQEEDPTAEDNTPIKLHNNRFTHLFEPLTGMYGWPSYQEFDPTPILGPFFLLFFSLCIGDAGYGLLLILAGFLIHKGKLKISMFNGMGPIIMALGVGSTIVGYLMGGFFGINIFQAEWFPAWAKVPMFNNLGEGMTGKITIAGQAYDVMMVLAIVIGVFHICLAMTIKAISYTIRDGFKNTLSTWGWLILVVGGIATGILAMLNVLTPRATQAVLIVIGVVSALGIFIFNTWGRNPLINIGSGLWDTYQMVTGLLGDVLSYIRLYALGLAGGMLGMAFNQLGEMVLGTTPNVGTWIGFILIITFGHVLNLLMACLGAFVHPLRLSFVEYFKNAGYEGSGKLYHPFQKLTSSSDD